MARQSCFEPTTFCHNYSPLTHVYLRLTVALYIAAVRQPDPVGTASTPSYQTVTSWNRRLTGADVGRAWLMATTTPVLEGTHE